MKFAIIASQKDVAGQNILGSLLECEKFTEKGAFCNNPAYRLDFEKKEIGLFSYPEEIIRYENAEKDIKADFYIFISKHRSKSGEKSLTMHFTGNFTKAEYGGKDKEFSTAPVL